MSAAARITPSDGGRHRRQLVRRRGRRRFGSLVEDSPGEQVAPGTVRDVRVEDLGEHRPLGGLGRAGAECAVHVEAACSAARAVCSASTVIGAPRPRCERAAAIPADMLANTRASAPLSAARARRASSRWAFSSRRRSTSARRVCSAGWARVPSRRWRPPSAARPDGLRGWRRGARRDRRPGWLRRARRGARRQGHRPIEGHLVGVGRGCLGGRRRGGAGGSRRARRPLGRAPGQAQCRHSGRRDTAARRVAFTRRPYRRGRGSISGRYRGGRQQHRRSASP